MGNSTYFKELLLNIEPSKTTKDYVSSLQNNLREYLQSTSEYRFKYLETFLSGSFAKNIATRPSFGEDKQDVDIMVVTNHTTDHSPIFVLKELQDTINILPKYKNNRLQTKSIGVEMANYHIDIIPLITEGNQYWIGNRENNKWELTKPKEHISWSTSINIENNKRYKPLVKTLKWWRKNKNLKHVKLPKGILLEKIIADNIGDLNYDSENLLVTTMEKIVQKYKYNYINKNTKPIILDPVLLTNNLADKYTFEDFKVFIELIEQDLNSLRTHNFNEATWRKVFSKVPKKL